MNQIDEFGMIEVEVEGHVDRRRAEVKVGRDILGRQRMVYAEPVLHENEILCSTVDGRHIIVKTHI